MISCIICSNICWHHIRFCWILSLDDLTVNFHTEFKISSLQEFNHELRKIFLSVLDQEENDLLKSRNLCHFDSLKKFCQHLSQNLGSTLHFKFLEKDGTVIDEICCNLLLILTDRSDIFIIDHNGTVMRKMSPSDFLVDYNDLSCATSVENKVEKTHQSKFIIQRIGIHVCKTMILNTISWMNHHHHHHQEICH